MKSRVHVLGLLCLAAACRGGAPEAVPADVIDRETFIATYVDLRDAAVVSPEFRVSAEQRANILARHGVDGESLVRFADAHGRDLEFMNAVWAEVDTRLMELTREAPPR